MADPTQKSSLELAQFDEALKRALPGGAIDKALSEKAGIKSVEYPGCYYRLVDGVREWFNPPMLLGVEYRTTERYMGKPVYVMKKEIPALGVGTETAGASVYFEDVGAGNAEYLVRYDAQILSASAALKLPHFDNNGKLLAKCTVNRPRANDQWIYGSVTSFTDLSAYKADFTIWFTKTTDKKE